MGIPSTTALKCFDVSARLLSFTKAAAELRLTQGAISHHILLLEKQLGTPLFMRSRRGLTLTHAGTVYLREVAPSLRQLERATFDIMSTAGRSSSLNLSCSSSLANHWLMPRMHSFSMAHPEITLNLSTRVGPIDFSVAHEEDASIEFCSGAENGLEAQLVKRPDFRLCAARTLLDAFGIDAGATFDSASLTDMLRGTALISHVTVPEAWPAWLEQAGLTAAIPAKHLQEGPKYALLSMALNGVLAGLGVALLPEYISSRAIQSGQLVELGKVGWVASRAYYLRWPKTRTAPERLLLFAAWLAEQSRADGESDVKAPAGGATDDVATRSGRSWSHPG